MSQNNIIELYTNLASHPEKDFGWAKGVENAISHEYKKDWLQQIPAEVWQYCAAVGNPFTSDVIREGNSVLDLGCGAGVDLCVASLLVGEAGKVTGIDITPAMVEKARVHAALMTANNINVLEGSFDSLPVENETMDVVISNGAINLVYSKEKTFAEIFRVLKPGGYLSFADMIKLEGDSEASCCSTESWADCVAGTLPADEIVRMLTDAGFSDAKLLNTNHYKTFANTIGATFIACKQ